MNKKLKSIDLDIEYLVNLITPLIDDADSEKKKNHLLRAVHLLEDARMNVQRARSVEPKRELEQWQKRVIAEKKELDEKIEKLKELLGLPGSFAIDANERDMMVRQYHTMQDYSAALHERIQGFGK